MVADYFSEKVADSNNLIRFKIMENLILTTYNIVGLKSGRYATIAKNKLSDIEGVISVNIDSAKKEVHITSIEGIKIDKLEQVLLKTDYYITEQKVNNRVVPPYRSAVNSARQKHNASKDVEGSSRGSTHSGPVTDYDEE
jgi:hypothetical protein